ncbi:MAG: glycine oxidase ThiO [Chloroflexi bacterium]|nr:glycine oxidase ThiO [Chloroflexota bacterium]
MRGGDTTAEVIIIGGGVIGSATAYYLARRGVQVLVLERDRIGSDASSVAAGTLAVLSHTQGPSPLVDFGWAGLQAYQGLADELKATSGVDIEYVPYGLLRVAFSEADAARLQAAISWQRDAGFEISWLDADEARRLEPGLGPDVIGASFSPQEHHIRSPRVTEAFAQGAARAEATFRLGADVVDLVTEGRRVTGVRLAGGEEVRGGTVLLAGGSWAGGWGERLGVPLPITPVRGQILILYQVPPVFRYSLSGNGGALVAKPDGTVIAGVTVERTGFDKRVTAGGIATIMQRCLALLPGIDGAEFRAAQVGLRPRTPDGLPLMGRIPGWEGVIIAGGHFRDGLLFGPLTGQLMAELITTGETSYPLEPFSPARFLEGPRTED